MAHGVGLPSISRRQQISGKHFSLVFHLEINSILDVQFVEERVVGE
jgi:hypothetical protein